MRPGIDWKATELLRDGKRLTRAEERLGTYSVVIVDDDGEELYVVPAHSAGQVLEVLLS